VRVLVHLAVASVLALGLAPLPASSTERRPAPAAASNQRTEETSRSPGRPGWMRAIDRLVGGRPMGVSVREGTEYLYRYQDVRRRTPASNEKLLLSMALLDLLGPESALVTEAAAAALPVAGAVAGDLWILGEGDPDVRESTMNRLAQALVAAGLTQVQGSVMGSTGYFDRDWMAPGWKSYFPRTQVALPTALTYEGNHAGGSHITDPELRAARALTAELRERDVAVAEPAGSGHAPEPLTPVAQVPSEFLPRLLDVMNRYSSNFWAEVLGKRLGVEAGGVPGSIAKGAAGIQAFAAAEGVVVKARDSSGLSYANRVSPSGIARLLGVSERRPWGEDLREALPEGGQGTLQNRLKRVPVHAKTGTLTSISALSGYVWLRRSQVWAEFSILSRGLSKDQAVRIEDEVVRLLWRRATA
jgi:D-alanyl-D-alanine carboxypeptidase